MAIQGKFKREHSLFVRSALMIHVICLSLSFGCAHPSPKESQFQKAGKFNLHQVRSGALREKMRSMNALMFEYELDELRYDEQRTRQAARMAEIAGSMSEAMKRPSGRQELGLDAKGAPEFSRLVKRLSKQALALHKAAQQEEAEAYSRLFRSMVNTCNECHSKFRGSS